MNSQIEIFNIIQYVCGQYVMRKAWDHGDRPPPPVISERPPFRAAAATRRNVPCQRTQRTGFVAARRSWAARGLSSGRFAVVAPVFALYEVEYWKYPFNQPDECFRGSVEPHMHRISSGIVRIERRGGEVVEL